LAGSTHRAIDDEYDWHRLARHCVEHSVVTPLWWRPYREVGPAQRLAAQAMHRHHPPCARRRALSSGRRGAEVVLTIDEVAEIGSAAVNQVDG